MKQTLRKTQQIFQKNGRAKILLNGFQNDYVLHKKDKHIDILNKDS